jgi:hypothetical protein
MVLPSKWSEYRLRWCEFDARVPAVQAGRDENRGIIPSIGPKRARSADAVQLSRS